jgi:hypothetical protein
MKRQIWKWGINPTNDGSISMPKGAELLSIQVQRGIPCIWALVDPAAEKEERRFLRFTEQATTFIVIWVLSGNMLVRFRLETI